MKKELVKLLKESIDIFACSLMDMPIIDPNLICHHLNTDDQHGVMQKKMLFGQEQKLTIKEEVEKLLAVGFIRETKYPSW